MEPITETKERSETDELIFVMLETAFNKIPKDEKEKIKPIFDPIMNLTGWKEGNRDQDLGTQYKITGETGTIYDDKSFFIGNGDLYRWKYIAIASASIPENDKATTASEIKLSKSQGSMDDILKIVTVDGKEIIYNLG